MHVPSPINYPLNHLTSLKITDELEIHFDVPEQKKLDGAANQKEDSSDGPSVCHVDASMALTLILESRDPDASGPR
jgi:hypothetical protein